MTHDLEQSKPLNVPFLLLFGADLQAARLCKAFSGQTKRGVTAPRAS